MKTLLLLTAAAAGIAATTSAQVAKPKADSACTTYPDGRVQCRVYRGGFSGDSVLGRSFFRMDSAMANRAALGIQLRATGTRRDTLGVFVESVTPKGPAENAGIVEGDRIAAINGVDVRSAAGDLDDSYTNGLASHRLSREVQKLAPGARVNLRVYSGGRFRDVQVVAGKASDVMHLGNRFNFRMPGPGGMMEFNGPGGMMEFNGPGAGAMMFRTPMPMQLRNGGVIRPRVRVRSGPGSIAPLRGPIHFDKGGAAIIGEFDGAEWDGIEPADAFDGVDVFEIDGGPVEIEEIGPVQAEAIREMGQSAVREGKWALKKLADEGLLA